MRYGGGTMQHARVWVVGLAMLLLGSLLIGGWFLTEDDADDGRVAVVQDATPPPSDTPSAPAATAEPTSSPPADPTPGSAPSALPSAPPIPAQDATGRPTTPETAAAPESTASLAPADSPTSREAEELVRAYFVALDEDRYDDASALTTGQAREETEAGLAELQSESDRQGVRIHLAVVELVMTPQPLESEGRPVQVEYLVQALADTFFGTITAQELRSEARFTVARLSEGDRIVRIEGDLVPTE
ncbi:MAG: hypothetical protein M3P51_03475 [Chloroflexota bacterium]|nr:hypothetical protein [Chloroflexota bacterium]